MDRVFIENLTVETVIGIYDWEREIRQAVSLDLEMDFDIRAAAGSDAIEDALDYKAVSKRLIHFIEQSQFQLVEALAERCAAIVLDELNVKAAETADAALEVGMDSDAFGASVYVFQGDQSDEIENFGFSEREQGRNFGALHRGRS